MAVAAKQQSLGDDFYTSEKGWIDHYDYVMSQFNPVADAQRYGFNPVTWLNSGAYQQYGNVALNSLNATIAALESKKSAYMSSMDTVSSMPNKISPLSAFGDAVSAGVNTWSTMHDNAASVSAKRDTLAATLKAIQQAKAKGNPLAGIGTPAFQATGTVRSGGGAAAALSLGGKDPTGIKDRTGEVSKVFEGSSVDSYWPDAMAVERRYGFFPAAAAGGVNMIADKVQSWTRQSTADLAAQNPGYATRFRPSWQDAEGAPSQPIRYWHPSTWGANPGADTGEQTWGSAPPLFGY